MDTGIKVGDIMTRNLVFVTPETNLVVCAKMMVKKRVGNLLIKEKGSDKLKGILTEKDIVWAVVKKSKRGLKDILAKDLMKKRVVTIKPLADVTEAMRRFKKKKVRRLPVVERGKLIGILTDKDILRMDPGLFQMIAQTIQIREETEKLKRRNVNSVRNEGVCEECGVFDILNSDGVQAICEVCFSKR